MTPLRILMLHSPYRVRGGEDVSAEQEAELLRAHGHEVLVLNRPTAEAGSLEMAAEAVGASSGPVRMLRESLEQFTPDVCHIQAPQRWGPEAIDFLRGQGIPILQAVRNYRIAGCVAGTFFRSGAPCTDCQSHRFAWPAIKHGCYHGGLGSVVATVGARLHDWSGVHFLAVSQYVKLSMMDAGFPANRISVKPNCVADPGIGDGRGGYALYVGDPLDSRPEKGWAMLAAAWAILNQRRDERRVPRVALYRLHPIWNVPHDEVIDAMKRAAFVVVPSVWHEPFGRVVIEAYACGTPVLVTRMGGLPEIVEHGKTGWVAEPDATAFALALEHAFDEAPRLRVAARAAYEARFTPAVNHSHLLAAYAKAMAAQAIARGTAEPMGAQL